jgi:flavodoxin
MGEKSLKSILLVFSFHHNNTEKIAQMFAKVLGAEIISPLNVNPKDLDEYHLLGFGSGIIDGKHHRLLLDFADRLPQTNDQKAFLFSTSGMAGKEKADEDHTPLRDTLLSKGYEVIDEFNCLGFNTNSVLRYLGGINKGRPNEKDLKNAEAFANNLLSHITVETSEERGEKNESYSLQ